MSDNQDTEIAAPDPSQQVSERPTKVTAKSYRRKYRKIMVDFEDAMKECNHLFREEQRVLDISQRLVEQNDQILELLHDLNHMPQIPVNLRYDLTSADVDPKKTNGEAVELDFEQAEITLKNARLAMQSGELAMEQYKSLKESLLQNSALAPSRSYEALRTQFEHEESGSDHTGDITSADPSQVGYPSAKQEERYLTEIDDYLTGKRNHPRPHATSGSHREKVSERDLQLRNPVSVYNWLRKHQPQVFLQDHDKDIEKKEKSRSSKRASTNTVKQEPEDVELYDEDGIAIDYGAPSKGKRKRMEDGDTGYRPKGGSSKSSKRRKNDSISSKKGKLFSS